MTSQKEISLFTEWAKTWEFYRSNEHPLRPGDSISRSVVYFIQSSDPEEKKTDRDTEDRGLALKILDRIDFEEPLPSGLCESLSRIARHDKPINVVLAIKCFEALFRKASLDKDVVSGFLECLVFSAQRNLEYMRGPEMLVFPDQLLLTLGLSKATGVAILSLQTLVGSVETAADSLLMARPSSKAGKNQNNHVLQKFLVFFTEIRTEKGVGKVTERIIHYLMQEVGDDSKELALRTYEKISIVCENNMGMLGNNMHFFTQSRFLDIRAFGVRCLLRILRQKPGFKKLREEIQAVIYNSARCALYEGPEYNTLVSLLESLYLLNRQYALDSSVLGGKSKVSRTTIQLAEHVFGFVAGLVKEHSQNEGADEKKKALDSGVARTVRAVVDLLEDVVAWSQDQAQFTQDMPTFSSKAFAAEDLRLLDSVFCVSLHVFRAEELGDIVERFYKVFQYTDLGYFSFLIKKHADLVVGLTEQHSSLFGVWNVYLENEKSAFPFSLHIFPKVADGPYESQNRRSTSFSIKAVDCIVSSKKLGAHQLEKLILSCALFKKLDRDFEVIKLLFGVVKPLYNSFTALPKIIYESADTFLDTLRLELRDDPHNDIYIYLALSIPLSITLVLQHFVKISYFIAEAFKREGEVLKEAFNLFEASLDLVSTEVFSSVPESIIASIVERLVEHSRGGLFALAATQLLSKLHGPMKIHLKSPSRVIHTTYPGYDIFLNVGDMQIRCDKFIQHAFTMVGGEFSRSTSPRVYVSTKFIHTFRETLFNGCSPPARKSAVQLLLAFLFNALGWGSFEEDVVYEKASECLSLVLLDSLSSPEPVQPTYKSSHYARMIKQSNANVFRYHHYIYDALLCIFKWEEYDFLVLVYETLTTFVVIERFYFRNTHFRLYFNYEFLVYGLCEAFSLCEVPDCRSKNSVFGKNISSFLKDPLFEEHVCSITTIPHRILGFMFNLGMEIGLSGSQVLGCELFEDILENLALLAFFREKKSRGQRYLE